MASEPSYYRAQAALAEAEADGAMLDNVRDRHMRSAQAFNQMAERQEKVAVMRAAREAASGSNAPGAPYPQEPTLESHTD